MNMNINMNTIFELCAKYNMIFTVLSIAISLLIVAVTHEDSMLMKKIGFVPTFLLYFCGIFAVLFTLKQLSLCIKNIYHKYKYRLANNKLAVKELWDYVDGLNDFDYNIISTFIKTKNEPQQFFWGVNSKLLESNRVHKRGVPPMLYGNEYEQFEYILSDDFYNLLNYSMTAYGKISRFERMSDVKRTV